MSFPSRAIQNDPCLIILRACSPAHSVLSLPTYFCSHPRAQARFCLYFLDELSVSSANSPFCDPAPIPFRSSPSTGLSAACRSQRGSAPAPRPLPENRNGCCRSSGRPRIDSGAPCCSGYVVRCFWKGLSHRISRVSSCLNDGAFLLYCIPLSGSASFVLHSSGPSVHPVLLLHLLHLSAVCTDL